MKTSHLLSRPMRVALLLGLGSTALDVLGSAVFGVNAWPDLGVVLVFIAVGALSLAGALLTAAIAVLCEIVLLPQRLDMVRILFLSAGAGLLLRSFPKMPLFAAVGILWLLALLPSTLNITSHTHFDLAWSNESLMLIGMWDVLLAIVAGLALLNPTIWGTISGRTRHLSLQQVLNHGIAGAALFPVIGAVLLFGLDQWMREPRTATNVLVLLAFSLLLAVWLAERVALLFAANVSPLLQSATSPGRRFRTLSQLATEVWHEPKTLWGKGALRSVPDRELTRSRAILASSQGKDTGICALSRNGTVAFMNERFRELAEVTMPDCLGRLFSKLTMNMQIRESVLALVEDSFTKGSGLSSELRINQFPNELAFFKITTELSHQRNTADAQSVIVTLSDITTRRTVGYEVIAAQRKDSLQTLVAGMCHAFNNVLTSIAGHASTARVSDDPFTLARSLDAVVDSTRDAGILVKQLLEFSNGRSYAPKAEALDQLLRSHRGVLNGIAGETHALECLIPNATYTVECDAGLVLLALTNLVNTARDSYQGKPGSITVSLDQETLAEDAPQLMPGSRPGTFARIQVRDKGQGVGPEVLRKLLNPEHYQDAAHARENMALATAYAIVRAHDGFLTAESHPERGTTISVYLPLVSVVEHPVTSSEDSEKQTEAHGTFARILVVEDDDNIREVVRAMLSTLGYSVATCSNGVDALKSCDETSFDLVLVDLIMPKMYGLDVIEQLKSRHPSIQTLLMTGSGHVSPGSETIGRLLPKPFDIETLAQAVRDSLKPSGAISKETGSSPGSSEYVH